MDVFINLVVQGVSGQGAMDGATGLTKRSALSERRLQKTSTDPKKEHGRYEPQACNGFPIRSFPQRIFLHPLLGETKKPDPLPLTYPCHRFGSGVFSFQTPRELIQALEPMGITQEEDLSPDGWEEQAVGSGWGSRK
jgi:hypothetical protein